MSRIKVIFFDLDDTLLDSIGGYEAGLRAAWHVWRREDPLSWPRFRKIYFAARAAVKKTLKGAPSARNRWLYFKRMAEDRLHNPRPRLVERAMKVYEAGVMRSKVILDHRLFSRLRKKFRLGIITNQICQFQIQKLRTIDPRGQYFSWLVTSEEAGVEKPHVGIYREACKRARCRPSEALMIGNSWTDDVQGPGRIGMKAIYVGPRQNRRHSKNIRQIPSLSHLLRLDLS